MQLIQRVAGVFLGVLFLLAVLVFASVALGILVAAGLVIWGWVAWRSRSSQRFEPRGSVVVEGEYRDVTHAQRLEQRDPRGL